MPRNIPSYSWEFHYPETPKWDLPIPAYSPDFFKQKAESIQETEIQKCDILRDSLKNGILISSEQEFQAWTNILSKNAIINLSQNDFSQINQWFGFVMQMNNHQEWVNIFPIESIMWLNPKGPFGKWGNISDNWIFTTSLNRDTTYTITENTISSIQEDAIVCETPKIEVPQIITSGWQWNWEEKSEKKKIDISNINEKKEKLEKWVNIQNETHYNQVKDFIESNYDIKLCNYNDIDLNQAAIRHPVTNVAFILKVDNINNQVVLYPAIIRDYSSHFWFIKEWIFIADMPLFWWDRINAAHNISFHQVERTEYASLEENQPTWDDIIKEQSSWITTEILKPEKNQTSEQIDSTLEQISIPENIEYTVVNWDKLWDIIQKYYNITDKRDTANIINKVVDFNLKHNPPSPDLEKQIIQDGIKWDKIHIWQKILLPENITWRTKTFTLIQSK